MQIRTATTLALKVAARSASEAAYLKTGFNLTKPSDVRAVLTERCNYKCQYCWHWRQDTYTEEMSLPEWQAVLSSIRAFVGRFAVQFTGGEPTLVPWFTDLCRFCSEQGIDWGVITNGSTLGAERVAELVSAGPLNVDVSLDGSDAGAHDVQRGVRGSLLHVRKGVARLVDERRRTGRSFAIRLKPTVTRFNIDDLNGIVDWAEGLPYVMVDFSPVRFATRKERGAMYPQREDEFDRLRRQLDRLVERKKAGSPIETSVPKLLKMIDHFRDVPATHGVDACRVGLRSITVRPNGDVDHCFRFARIGNLRTDTMRDIWRSEARKSLVGDTVSCDLLNTVCSTSCQSHRSLKQDIARGVQLVRAAL